MNQDRLTLFDKWAKNYDPSSDLADYPFAGYDKVLDSIAKLTTQEKPQKILDLGTGTGNLELVHYNGHEVKELR